MWPWEHVLVAYLAFSVARHVTTHSGPSDAEAIVLAVGAILPDLVDKPLFWQFELFTPSYGPGHSVFIATGACLIAVVLARHRKAPVTGVAFSVGYLSHLLTDVVSVRGGVDCHVDRVLWPIQTPPPSRDHASFFDAVSHYLGRYLSELQSGEHRLDIAIQGIVGIVVLGLWIYDGTPGFTRTDPRT